MAQTDKERLDSLWNTAELLKRVEGDQELLRELLLMFREDSLSNLQEARSLLTQNDLQGLSRVAHTLKGMLRNLSMTEAAEIAATLESKAREGLKEESRESLDGLEKGITDIAPQVDAQLAELKI